MSLMDIIGPVMIGPSSSHTAGAVRIGMLARRIWGWQRPLGEARLFLRGSFAATYWGHGTDRGLVAGLLRMNPDDLRIPHAFEAAAEAGLKFSFDSEEVDGAHPNSVRVLMTDGGDRTEIVGASVGGGASISAGGGDPPSRWLRSMLRPRLPESSAWRATSSPAYSTTTVSALTTTVTVSPISCHGTL